MKLVLEKWKTYVQDCENAEGKDGDAVVKKVGSDEIESCHNTKELANKSITARHANTDEKLEEDEDVIEETSTTGGVQGYAGSPIGDKKTMEDFNESEKDISKLKGKRLAEMFSTSTQTGGLQISIVSAEKEHAGHVERSRHQGLRNVMENDDDTTYVLDDAEPIPVERDPMEVLLEKNGYKFKRKLGSGQYGDVVLAEKIDEHGGHDFAIKILKSGKHQSFHMDREVRNYREISNARGSDPLIADHFPEVEKIFEDEGLTFIVMEVLIPLHGELKSMLKGQEALIKGDYGEWASEKAISLYDKTKDVSKRVELALRDDKQLAQLIKDVKRSILMALEEARVPHAYFGSIKKVLNASISPGTINRWERAGGEAVSKYIGDVEKLIIKYVDPKSDGGLVYLTTMDDMKKSSYSMFFVAYISKQVIESIVKFTKNIENIEKVLRQVLSDFQDSYRLESPVKSGYTPRDFPKTTLDQDKKIPRHVRKIISAIKKLSEKTGLFARDLHDMNIMRRPGGDLVIVDVGMFKTADEIKQMLAKRRNEGKLRENRIRIKIKR